MRASPPPAPHRGAAQNSQKNQTAKQRARVHALQEELQRLRALRGAGASEPLDAGRQRAAPPVAAAQAAAAAAAQAAAAAAGGGGDAAMEDAAAGGGGEQQQQQQQQQEGGGGDGGVWL